jgi:AcrR family transcriptional regulator
VANQAPRRRPGRPAGADSAETRARILRAARDVINERGYHAATFQSISRRAGLSRPTMHYYFDNREQVFAALQQEAYSAVAECIAGARRQPTLLTQLAGFATALRRLERLDKSMLRFVVASRLEMQRSPEVRQRGPAAADAITEFYRQVVTDAVERGEIPPDTDVTAVADMLFAMFWGMGFSVSFMHAPDDFRQIAKQVERLFVEGLLASDGRRLHAVDSRRRSRRWRPSRDPDAARTNAG